MNMSSSNSSSSSTTVGATVATFRGSTSHEFMIWFAEWKKFLVYQGVHHIILDGKDSRRGKNYNPSMDFKIFEPDFFMEFFNFEVIKSRKDKEEALITQVLAEWPWRADRILHWKMLVPGGGVVLTVVVWEVPASSGTNGIKRKYPLHKSLIPTSLIIGNPHQLILLICTKTKSILPSIFYILSLRIVVKISGMKTINENNNFPMKNRS